MKRFLMIMVMVSWCNVGFAGCIEGDCNNGYGTATYTNGDKYVGEWKDRALYGQGTFTWASGSKYIGEYKNNKRHGQGTYIYANGDKYVGGYKDGKRHGLGTFTWADGAKYVGEHKDSKRHGQGTHTYADGTVEEGIWKKDKFVKRKKISKAEAREDKKIAKAQSVCRKVGLTPGTDKFIDCTIKMLTTTGGKQTVIVGQQRTLKTIYPLHCRQMGGASAC